SICSVICILFFMYCSYCNNISLSLHDSLPIYRSDVCRSLHLAVDMRKSSGLRANNIRRVFITNIASIPAGCCLPFSQPCRQALRSEEHTSELQSRENLVCRLLLEK